MKKGKFIVIDGIDGSGKATQTKLLTKRLKKAGVKVKTIDFPRYYNNFFGGLIGKYLSGVYGDFTQVDPRLASVLYAADRFESKVQVQTWLDQGYYVVADRYVSANQIHQGGKISDAKKRSEFLEWLDQMEHQVFKVPRPDLVIFLDVPYEVSKKWLENKVTQRSKKYAQGRRDVAEDNLKYLKFSRNSGITLSKKYKNWRRIECCKKMVCMLPEEVHERVFDIVKKKFKLR